MDSETKIEDFRRAGRIHRGIAIFYLLIVLICCYLMIIKSVDWGFIGMFFGFLGSVHFFAYYGLNKNSSWAKVLSVMVAIALLFGFPIGTILGGTILYYMVRTPREQVDKPMQTTADAPAD